MAEANRFDQLVDQWEPVLRRAFLNAVAAIRDRVQVAYVAELLERGDVEAAVEAVGLDPTAFRSLEIGIEQAYEDGGRWTTDRIPVLREPSGYRLQIRFDVRNPRAEGWLREHSSTLVTRIIEDQRQTIRQHLTAGMMGGQNPRTVALELAGRVNRETGRREGGVIGLTGSQEEWARRYAAELSDPATMRDALGRALRDRRFDRSVMKAIREDTPLPAEMRERMVRAYRARALRHRAETIARTEAMASLHAAQVEAFEQAVGAGQVRRAAVQKVWHSAADRRVRHTHRVLHGQTVGLEGVFLSPSGAALRYPGDPAAPGSETVMCRCWVDVRIDHLHGVR